MMATGSASDDGARPRGPLARMRVPEPSQPDDEIHAAGSSLPTRLVSNVVSFAWVRRCPPRPIRHSPPTSRTVVNPGERWPALLESVLRAIPQEFESPILRHADLQEYRSWPPTRGCPCWPWTQLMGSIFWLPGAAAGPNRSYCAWSPVPRTALTDVAHAVEACALPVKADHDRLRPAGTRPPTDPSH